MNNQNSAVQWSSESERIKFDRMIEDTKRYLQYEKKRVCMFPGCNENAIDSHAISKRSSLNLIAKNGNLQTIASRYSPLQKDMQFSKIGINQATCFKGFCEKHDTQLFANLDKGIIKSSRDVAMQLYRSTCHTLFMHHFFAELRLVMNKYFDIERFEKIGIEVPGKEKEIEYKAILKRLHQRKKLLEAFINSDLDEPFPQSPQTIVSLAFENYKAIFREIPYQIPVAISQTISKTLDGIPFEITLNVIPNKDSTCIIFFWDSNVYHADDYMFNCFVHDINLLCLIELSMIQYENWYISPITVDALSEEKRTLIQEDVFCWLEFIRWSEYDISIFDEVRRAMLIHLSEKRKNLELHRLDNLPRRADFKLRRQIIDNKITNDSLR